MLKQLDYEFNLIIKRNQFIKILCIALLISFIYIMSQYINNNDLSSIGSPANSFFFLDIKHSNFLYIFLISMPLICALPYSDNYLTERKFESVILTRVKRTNYYFAKMLVAFIVGFILIFTFLLSMYLFNYIIVNNAENTFTYLPSSIIENDLLSAKTYYIFNDYLINDTNIYNIIFILILSVYGGLLSLSSLTLSFFTRNKIITYMGLFAFATLQIPFLYFVLKAFESWSLIQVFSPKGNGVYQHYTALTFWIVGSLIVNFSLNIYKQHKDVYS